MGFFLLLFQICHTGLYLTHNLILQKSLSLLLSFLSGMLSVLCLKKPLWAGVTFCSEVLKKGALRYTYWPPVARGADEREVNMFVNSLKKMLRLPPPVSQVLLQRNHLQISQDWESWSILHASSWVCKHPLSPIMLLLCFSVEVSSFISMFRFSQNLQPTHCD